MNEKIDPVPVAYFIPPPPPQYVTMYRAIQEINLAMANRSEAAVLAVTGPLMRDMVAGCLEDVRTGGAAFMKRDRSKYGFYPGMQLYFLIHRLLPVEHHGIYIGNGLFLEVGGRLCGAYYLKKKSATNQCVGVSTLQWVNQRSWLSRKQPVGAVTFAGFDDSSVAVAVGRLERALYLLQTEGPVWNYDIVSKNCQHMSTMVSTGTCGFRTQVQTPIVPMRYLDTTYRTKENKKGCRSACRPAYTSVRGCRCTDAPGWWSGKCSVDPGHAYDTTGTCHDLWREQWKDRVDLTDPINTTTNLQGWCEQAGGRRKRPTPKRCSSMRQ